MKTTLLSLYDRVWPKRLLDSVTLFVVILVVILLVAIGGIFSQLTYDVIEKQTEKRAIQAAKHISLQPELPALIMNDRLSEKLLAIATNLKKETEAKYILITNSDGKILAHSEQDLIGERILSPLTLRVLTYGRPYSENTFERGEHFIRGSVPILGDAFKVAGMVSVGYAIADVRKVSDAYLDKIIFSIFVFFTLGLIAANFIARGVKWLIMGMEPSEIAYLFNERTALIESIREGIISTDAGGMITLVNEAAVRTLKLTDKRKILNRSISSFFPLLDAQEMIRTGESLTDREFVLKGIPVIVNIASIQERRGLVVSFRKKEEIDIVANELAQVRTFSEMLRAQTHEYSNCLHTIVGLIQIEAYEDVLDFIAEETEEHRMLIRFLTENIPDRILSSLIIGKYMYAMELKVEFIIDPESRMIDVPDSIDRHTVATALGNIIDNAFEASLAGTSDPTVKLFMSDYGNDLIFEIEDSGKGLSEEMEESLFNKGVSTKSGGDHGYGLYLAKSAMNTLGGDIWFEKTGESGMRFELIIPKKSKGHETD